MNGSQKKIMLVTRDVEDMKMRPVMIDNDHALIQVGVSSSISKATSKRDQIILEQAIAAKNIVVSCASEYARTIYTTIEFACDDGEGNIDESEIERLITASIWKLFEKECRGIAASLGIPDRELVIADAHIWDLMINGKSVLNPIALERGPVAITLSATCMSEDAYGELQECFGDAMAFVVEGDASAAWRIAQTVGEHALIGMIGPSSTKTYYNEKKRFVYDDSFEWGIERLVAEIISVCGVSREIALYCLGVYEHGRGMPRFRERLESVIHGEMQLCIHGMEHARQRRKNVDIILHSSLPLPHLPSSMHQFSSGTPSEMFGCRIEWEEWGLYDTGSMIAPVIDAYLAPQYRVGNGIAKRYLRWRERN